MGGNALNFKTRRLDKAEFLIVRDEVLTILRQLYPNTSFWALEGYRDKTDFGDLDIIIRADNKDNYDFTDIRRAFRSKDWNRNSNCWSLDYKDFQIDLIFMAPENYASSIAYYQNGDCSNILGVIFKKFGLKFGHRGLSYTVFHGNYPFAEIVLTKDIGEILRFIGLYEQPYLFGFNNLEEIFTYITKSVYFHPDIFLFENLNHENRTRNRKRPTYAAFVEWCLKNKDSLPHYKYFSDNNIYWESLINASFPGFLDKVAYYREQIETVERFKTRYNGELVSELTGLSGKELGQFMAFIREHGGSKETFMQKVLDLDENGVKVLVLEHYKLFNNSCETL